MQKEVWKPIKGYENYEISSNGRVRNSKTGRTLKQGKNNSGYFQVTLCKNGKPKTFSVHRLVAYCYVQGYDETVNHIDGNKTNNYFTNLEWVSNAENQKHAWENGLYDGRKRMCLDLRSGIYYETASDFSRSRLINRKTLHKHLVKEKDYGFDVKYV